MVDAKVAPIAKEIPTFTEAEVKDPLAAASERTRLYLLLMLNIGAYQSDIAALKPNQVDWKTGRIVRRRTKTETGGNVPTVDYLLWDETFRLLKQFGRAEGPLVILNQNGSPVYRRPVKEDGKVGNTDNIKKGYERACKKLGVKKPKPLMCLRKSSPTLLEDHGVYGRFAQYFLSQAPESLTEQRYARPSPAQFDKAVRWLGKKYGLATTR